MISTLINYKPFVALICSFIGIGASKVAQTDVIPNSWEELVLFISSVLACAISTLILVQMIQKQIDRYNKKHSKKPSKK